MINRYTQGKITWLDVLKPTPDEIHEIFSECDIPLTLANDLTSMTPRSEVVTEKKSIKITLDYPIVKRTDINHPHEIKFIATKSHLITVHFEEIEALHKFTKDFEVLSILKNKKSNATGGHLLLTLLSRLYLALDIKLDYLQSRLSDIEEGIFSEKEKEMVFEISELSRRLIDFKQTIQSHKSALNSLDASIKEVFTHNHEIQVSEIKSQYEHLMTRTQSLSGTLIDLRETNNSLLTTKQNEIMKTFTILAFITFPLTLFTSMFGMNTKTTPILGRDFDFWIIVSIMAVVSISFFMYFRYKKWM